MPTSASSSVQPVRPTDTELSILRMLWTHGPSTVRQVHERLQRRAGYTSTLKLMQIMTAKGQVRRDDSRRRHVYMASLTRRQVQRQLVGDLLDRAFDGSARSLVMSSLAARPLTPADLAAIRGRLDEIEATANAHPSPA
jgi:predicted transcriptional regulator